MSVYTQRKLRKTETVSQAIVSVVIPTLNAAATVRDCLASLRNQTYKNIEILVADGGSRDTTEEITKEYGARFMPGPFSRSSGRLLAAIESKGAYLLFLDADQLLEPTVVEECVYLCGLQGTATVKIPEKDCGNGIWARCRVLDRQLADNEALTYPRFFPRSVYLSVGGHLRGLEDYMEDRDLYLRLRERGFASLRCKGQIINKLGYVNPLALGVKGARAAKDAREYFSRNLSKGETAIDMVRMRLQSFSQHARQVNWSLSTLIMMPPYLVMVYGLRLFRAFTGELAARLSD